MTENNFIGQFAGEKQWEQIGRCVKYGENPLITGENKTIINNDTGRPLEWGIFAYEQTEPMEKSPPA